jgi:4'-phosphopantetheinyl transferase
MTRVYWLTQCLTDLPAADDWMAAGEAARLEGMRTAKRRRDYRLGRWTARRALAACPMIPPGAVEVRAATSGAPEVMIAGAPAPCALSISHSAGVALCAVSPTGGRLGCDIEVIEPRDLAFIETFFTRREQSLVESISADERALLTTIIWSAKESALKALGEGLRLDTRSVEIALPVNAPAGLWSALIVTGDDRIPHGWWRQLGKHVLTIIASPPFDQPLELTLASERSNAGTSMNAVQPSSAEPYTS